MQDDYEGVCKKYLSGISIQHLPLKLFGLGFILLFLRAAFGFLHCCFILLFIEDSCGFFVHSSFKLENYISKMYIGSCNRLNVMDDLGEDYMVTVFA